MDPVVRSIGRLQKRFPIAFPKNPAPKLPLKIGIFEDLVAHAKELSLTEAELRDAIKTWCRGSRYWKALVEGAARVDLSGAEAGQVSAQEAAGAQRLQAHRANKGAQKGAEKAAQAQGAAGEVAAAAQSPAPEAALDATAVQTSGEVAAPAVSEASAPAVSAASADAADSTESAPERGTGESTHQAASAVTDAADPASSPATPDAPAA